MAIHPGRLKAESWLCVSVNQEQTHGQSVGCNLSVAGRAAPLQHQLGWLQLRAPQHLWASTPGRLAFCSLKALSLHRYGSDITVTLPANGKFSNQQRAIYEVSRSPCIPKYCRFTRLPCILPPPSESPSRYALNSQGVLNTMESVRKRLKPGVAWPDMHRLADRCNLEALAAEVIMNATLIDEALQAVCALCRHACGRRTPA